MKTEALIEKAFAAANDFNVEKTQRLLIEIADAFRQGGIGNIDEFTFESECGFKDKLAAIANYLSVDWQSMDSGVWYYPMTGQTAPPPEHIPTIVFVEYGDTT